MPSRCDYCKQQRFTLHLNKHGAFCVFCLNVLAERALDLERSEGGRVQTAAGLGASTGHRKTKIGGK